MASASDFKVKKGLQVHGGDINLGEGQDAIIQVDARSSGAGRNLTISSGESSAGGSAGGKIVFQTAEENSLTQAAEIDKFGNLTMNDKVISGFTNLTASNSGVSSGNDLATLYRISMPNTARDVTPQNNTGFMLDIGMSGKATIDTAQDGTAADFFVMNIDAPTIGADNTGTTVTDATTLHISGAPAAHGSGTVPTVTNAYALQVAAGTSLFSGALTATGTTTLSTLVASTADINAGTIDGATIATSDITVGSGKTLDVSSGTLTLADNQISGNAVEGGTIAATTITALTTAGITASANIDIGAYDLRAQTLTSDVATGTAPLTVSSTTNVANLNASSLGGATFAEPGAIGGTTAAAGTFTALTGTSLDINGAADISGDLTLSAGGDGALTFSTASSIKILDNNSAALVIEEANNAYMTFVTTDDGEKIVLSKKLEGKESVFDTSMTMGTGAQSDMLIKFDGAAQDFHLGIDDSEDEFVLGGGTTAGSNIALKFNSSGEVLTIGTDTPSSGQFLKYDGTQWVADNVSGGTADSLAADDLAAGDGAVLLTTTTGNITIDAAANNSDIIFKGTDGGSDTTFLTLDGSEAGAATFNNKVVATELDISGDCDIDGTTNLDNTDIDGTLAVDGATISLDATTSLNIDNSNTSNGITIGTATSGVPISIGHTVSETTVNDNLTVTGNLTVSGTTTTVNSTVVSIADPIFELGSSSSDDDLDRGIKMKWHNGSAAKTAFMGYDDSAGKFVMIADATDSSNVFSGTASTLVANLDGTVNTASQASITTMANLTTVGALNAGSITSGFGTINTGSSNITTSGTVAAGPITGSTLDLTDRVALDSTAVIDTYKGTLTSDSAATMFTLASDTYSAGKVLASVWLDDGSDHRSVTEFLFTYQGASTPAATGNIHMTEYGLVDTSGSQLATFDVVKSSGNILVQISPTSDTSTKVRAQITQFVI